MPTAWTPCPGKTNAILPIAVPSLPAHDAGAPRHAARRSPSSRSMSPGLNQPARFASSSVIGSDADEVLPYFSMFIQHFEAGMSSRSSAASMIRMLAWWAMT